MVIIGLSCFLFGALIILAMATFGAPTLQWRNISGLGYALCLNLTIMALNASYFTAPTGSELGHGEAGIVFDLVVALGGAAAAVREVVVMVRHRSILTNIPALILDLSPFPLACYIVQSAIFTRLLQTGDF